MEARAPAPDALVVHAAAPSWPALGSGQRPSRAQALCIGVRSTPVFERLCHPRLPDLQRTKTLMAGTSPATTSESSYSLTASAVIVLTGSGYRSFEFEGRAGRRRGARLCVWTGRRRTRGDEGGA